MKALRSASPSPAPAPAPLPPPFFPAPPPPGAPPGPRSKKVQARAHPGREEVGRRGGGVYSRDTGRGNSRGEGGEKGGGGPLYGRIKESLSAPATLEAAGRGGAARARTAQRGEERSDGAPEVEAHVRVALHVPLLPRPRRRDMSSPRARAHARAGCRALRRGAVWIGRDAPAASRECPERDAWTRAEADGTQLPWLGQRRAPARRQSPARHPRGWAPVRAVRGAPVGKERRDQLGKEPVGERVGRQPAARRRLRARPAGAQPRIRARRRPVARRRRTGAGAGAGGPVEAAARGAVGRAVGKGGVGLGRASASRCARPMHARSPSPCGPGRAPPARRSATRHTWRRGAAASDAAMQLPAVLPARAGPGGGGAAGLFCTFLYIPASHAAIFASASPCATPSGPFPFAPAFSSQLN